MKKRYVIIGSSAAGLSAANKLAELDPGSEIICISKETCYPYNKCKLAKYMAGKIQQDDLFIFSEQEAMLKNIDLCLGVSVQEISSDNKYVMLSTREKVTFDSLFIGTGASAILPKIPGLGLGEAGKKLKGVFTFHTLHDVQEIIKYSKTKPKEVVIVGSGMTGLECASALSQQGISVSVIEKERQILSGSVDRVVSDELQARMRAYNVAFYSHDYVTECLGQEKVTSVILQSGKTIGANMVILSVGVCPNSALAASAGIQVGDHGIIVDDYMRTSIANIYAGGDTIAVFDRVSNKKTRSFLWSDACCQGIVAAHNMVGDVQKYPGIYPVVVSKLWDVLIASCGPVARSSYFQEIIKQESFGYKKIILENGFVRGFLLMGDISDIGELRMSIINGEKL